MMTSIMQSRMKKHVPSQGIVNRTSPLCYRFGKEKLHTGVTKLISVYYQNCEEKRIK